MNYQGAHSSQMVVRGRILTCLIKTGFWVKFMAVLCFVAAILFILPIVGMSAFLLSLGLPPGLLTGFLPFLIFAVPSVLYIISGVKMLGYANAVKRLSMTRTVQDFEAVTDRHRSMWFTFGMIAVGMIIVLVVLVVASASMEPTSPY